MLIDPEKIRHYQDIFASLVNLEDAKKALASALAAQRHVILSGPPGSGKTTLARQAVHFLKPVTVNACGYNCPPDKPLCPICKTAEREGKKMPTKTLTPEERFIRIQGSPDLTVEDLLGDIDPAVALKKGAYSIEAFKPGKIFKANQGILFFDEINRAPERVQNALLQVLEEGRATLGSYAVDMPADFIVIATMNPNDASTERLSKVFLDRFDIIPVHYPTRAEDEYTILTQRAHIPPGMTIPDSLLHLIAHYIITLRNHPSILQGPSVRASIGLVERAATLAHVEGETIVTPSHVRRVIPSVLLHRITFKPGSDDLAEAERILTQTFENLLNQKGEGVHHRP